MNFDTLKNARANSEYVTRLRTGTDWQKVKTLCNELSRPVIERASVRDVILQVYPTMSPVIAGDVANFTMDELVAH